MLLTQILSQQFNKQAVVELLKNIPGITWTPAVNEHHRNMSSSFNVRKSFNTLPQFNQIVTVPQAFSWLDEKPECLKVRDHGDCCSSLAFQAVGQFSDNRCISKFDKTRIDYSEQYHISCDTIDLGCDGGYLAQGVLFIKQSGIPTSQCVSYKSGTTGLRGKCPTTCDDGSEINLVKSQNYFYVGGEEGIKAALSQGTVYTYFEVYEDFMYYVDGIYRHQYGDPVTGIVVSIVGYGDEEGIPYWVVRNSLGTSWGENGYFRVLRGRNECEIEVEAYIQIV
ncbi:Cathepsin_B [Hexamita inflata]|uniref:Cathepsin B n=1 Tax=Hexamita inflata TaxID=28002 RepID=A0AA86QXR8_9EUKA|nr:Cathepsin B [Hexamita inflata]